MHGNIPRQFVADAGPAWTPLRAVTSLTDNTLTAITAAPTAESAIAQGVVDPPDGRHARPAISYIIAIDDLLISTESEVAVSILEETSGTVLAKIYLPDNGTTQVTLRDLLKCPGTPTAGKKIMAQLSGTANCTIVCNYHFEQV